MNSNADYSALDNSFLKTMWYSLYSKINLTCSRLLAFKRRPRINWLKIDFSLVSGSITTESEMK